MPSNPTHTKQPWYAHTHCEGFEHHHPSVSLPACRIHKVAVTCSEV